GDARGLSARGAHASLEDHRLAEKVAHEGRGGLLVQTAWRPDLLDASAVHHRDAVGEAERFDLIVGDEEDGDAETAPEEFALAPPASPRAGWGVRGGEGRGGGERAGRVDGGGAQGEALHLPPAQQRARPLAEPAEPDQVEDAGDLVANHRARNAAELERVGHVL